MSQRTIHGLVIECVTGDIIRQSDMAAIVNAANAQLRMVGLQKPEDEPTPK